MRCFWLKSYAVSGGNITIDNREWGEAVLSISRTEVIFMYRSVLGRDPESEEVIQGHSDAFDDIKAFEDALIGSDEVRAKISSSLNKRYVWKRNDDRPTILVQNFHFSATVALIRDFKKVGLRVLCPDSNWGFDYYFPNDGVGGELISKDEYFKIASGRALIACRPQERDISELAACHGDKIVLHVANHHTYYKQGLSDVLICPDIITYQSYPEDIRHKLLYFPRPYLSANERKDIALSYSRKLLSSFINQPSIWVLGEEAFIKFASTCPFEIKRFGDGAKDGALNPYECNLQMARSFLTVHFKDQEAYGLSCLESMMLGTPIVTLECFLGDKTLGRYFLNERNSICTKTTEEAIDRLTNLSFEEYSMMSESCINTVYELTNDKNTVDRLREVIFD